MKGERETFDFLDALRGISVGNRQCNDRALAEGDFPNINLSQEHPMELPQFRHL